MACENRPIDSNVMRFKIMGNPIPLKRPRFSDGKVYDPQKQEKLIVGIMIKSQAKGFSFAGGNVVMDITFYFPISRAVSRVKKQKMLGSPHSYRPDISNCIKFYEDVMQDVGIFNDDSQIIEIKARKLYDDGNGPRVEIILKETL